MHWIHICVSVHTCVLPGKPSQFHLSVGKEGNTNRKIKFVENENGIVANACIAQVPWAGRLCCRTVSGGGEASPVPLWPLGTVVFFTVRVYSCIAYVKNQ